MTAPAFLAAGGDSFAVLKIGEDRKDGPIDVDALAWYLGKVSSPAAPLDAPPGGGSTATRASDSPRPTSNPTIPHDRHQPSWDD